MYICIFIFSRDSHQHSYMCIHPFFYTVAQRILQSYENCQLKISHYCKFITRTLALFPALLFFMPNSLHFYIFVFCCCTWHSSRIFFLRIWKLNNNKISWNANNADENKPRRIWILKTFNVNLCFFFSAVYKYLIFLAFNARLEFFFYIEYFIQYAQDKISFQLGH